VLPAKAALPEIELDALTLPLDLPLSLPSDLVRQRPDILSAEAQLHAASADIGVATAAMFPSFSLNGTYGAAGSSLGNLFGAARDGSGASAPRSSRRCSAAARLWYGRPGGDRRLRAVRRPTTARRCWSPSRRSPTR
jgi:hypothetical protein